jgi:hypothetical protein
VTRSASFANRAFLLAAIAAISASCHQNSEMSDQELTKKLVGTWIADEMRDGYRLYGETDFHRDGVQSGNGVVHVVDGTTTTMSFSGNWSVRNGRLVSRGEMMTNNRDNPEAYDSEDRIERVTDSELILVDKQGGRTVRHRKN